MIGSSCMVPELFILANYKFIHTNHNKTNLDKKMKKKFYNKYIYYFYGTT